MKSRISVVASLLAVLTLSVSLWATNLVYFSSPGAVIVASSGCQFDNIVFTSVAGSNSAINIYDCTTPSAESAANLKFSALIGTFNSLTPSSTLNYTLPIKAMFRKGIVVDSGTATITATYGLTTF